MKYQAPILTLAFWASVACSSDTTDSSQSNTAGGTGGASGGLSGASGGDTSAPSGGADPGAGGSLQNSGGAPSGGSPSGGASSGGSSSGGVASGGTPDATGGAPDGAGGSPTPIETQCGLPSLSAPVGGASSQLSVLNWAGKSAAVSYTFDDANGTQIDNYDALNALGVPFTFYVTTNWIGDPSDWVRAAEDGHEIGNHTVSHPSQATGAELDNATAYIEQQIGVTPLTMAAPNGDSSYSSPAMSRFLLNRGVGGGSIPPLGNTNLYSAPTFIPPQGAGKSQLDSGVSAGTSQGNWQTVTIHAFEQGGYQPISLNGFLDHVTELRDSDEVWIDTVVAVASYYIGQKLIDEAAPTNSGGESTWSWSLPAHFPAERCLRITSTGTVLQNGSEIAQDPMGYYEISLDAGAVTVRD